MGGESTREKIFGRNIIPGRGRRGLARQFGLGPENPPRMPGKDKGFIVAERGGSFGGGVTPQSSFLAIESDVSNAMWILETNFKTPAADNPRREDILALLEAAEEVKIGFQRGQISELRRQVEAKLACIEFFYDEWRGGADSKEGTQGTTKGMQTMAVRPVDDAQIFTRLLKIPEVAKEFANLIKTASNIDPVTGLRVRAMYSWNSRQHELSGAADNGNYQAEESGKLYAWMLYEISGMHAEADDVPLLPGQKVPGFPEAKPGMIANRLDSYMLKVIAHLEAVVPYEKGSRVSEFWQEFWKKKALLYEAHSVDPTDIEAARTGAGAREIPGGRDKRTGEPATHGDVMYMGNFLCAPYGIVNWKIQPQEVINIIQLNQTRLGRVVQSSPRGVDELVDVDWTKVNLQPGNGLHTDAYVRYHLYRSCAEQTYNWWMEHILSIKEKEAVVKGALLKAIEGGESHSAVYANWCGKERQEAEIGAMKSESLWVHTTTEIREMFRDKSLQGLFNEWANAGGDQLKWLELYGRGFGENEMKESPMTPWQAAFILLRIYGSQEKIKVKGGSFSPNEVINKAIKDEKIMVGNEMRDWAWCAADSGNRGQSFTDYLKELDAAARQIEEISHEHRSGDIDAIADSVGVTANLLTWSLSATEKDKVRTDSSTKADSRLLFLIQQFSDPIIGFYTFQRKFFEEPVKKATGYSKADETSIYHKHVQMEQLFGQLLLRLREFSDDGAGDKFQELCAGSRIINPGVNYNSADYLEFYQPPETENKLNGLIWLYPDILRPIEVMMLKLSAPYVERNRNYWYDPETLESGLNPWDVIGSVEDRAFFLNYIGTKDQNLSAVFNQEWIDRFKERFHCAEWDGFRHKALRKVLGLKPPVGFKEEDPNQQEKKTKEILGKASSVFGGFLGWLPWPRPISQWFVVPAAYNVAKFATFKIAELWPATSWLITKGFFNLSLPELVPVIGGATFFEISVPFILGIYALRPFWQLLRLGAFTADKIPVLRSIIGCRQTRIDLDRRWKETNAIS